MPKFLTISRPLSLLHVPIDAIMYIRADGNYTDIVTRDGRKYSLTMQIGAIHDLILDQFSERELPPIVRTRSHIIFLDYLLAIDLTKQTLSLSNYNGVHVELRDISLEALKTIKDMIARQTKDGK